ncbi:hypothetical protein VI06_14615 [Aquitalea magnusonii]|nr:hypothetical protein VI06_14615 [Aquitalea magnusonii]
MSDDSLDEYFDALLRLSSGKPIRVCIGSAINNDNVSLEAGRKRGSIKKSREKFSGLIFEIEKARNVQIKSYEKCDSAVVDELKEQVKFYKDLYHQALARELSLVAEIYALKKKKFENGE